MVGIPDGHVVLQLVGRDDDHFVHISKTELIQISEETDVPERARQVRAKAAPVAVCSTGEVDYVLVLDGEEDEASWIDLLEAMEFEGG